jgi:hypothetical protein
MPNTLKRLTINSNDSPLAIGKEHMSRDCTRFTDRFCAPLLP